MHRIIRAAHKKPLMGSKQKSEAPYVSRCRLRLQRESQEVQNLELGPDRYGFIEFNADSEICQNKILRTV